MSARQNARYVTWPSTRVGKRPTWPTPCRDPSGHVFCSPVDPSCLPTLPGADRSQMVVVVQVLVPQRQGVDPLGDQFLHGMLDPVRIAVICETVREFTNDSSAPLGLPQQKPAAVRGDPTPIEPRHNVPPAKGVKSKRLSVTLCHRKAATSVSKNLRQQQVFSRRSQPFSSHPVRNAG